MKSLAEGLKMTSLDDIKKEIDEHKELKQQMVGQLYPTMLTDEISQLTSHYATIFRFVKNNMEKNKRTFRYFKKIFEI